MKSNVIALKGVDNLNAALAEVEKCTSYNNLDKKPALRVRLLAEELIGMMPALLEHSEGTFWIENDGNKYELHVNVQARETGFTTREKLMAVSTSGKNAAAVGIMGKIRAAAEMMLYASEMDVITPDFYDNGMEPSMYFGHAWSLSHYMTEVRTSYQGGAKQAEWDELEKSIVAKLADDVVVGIKGKKVDIIVKKEFA